MLAVVTKSGASSCFAGTTGKYDPDKILSHFMAHEQELLRSSRMDTLAYFKYLHGFPHIRQKAPEFSVVTADAATSADLLSSHRAGAKAKPAVGGSDAEGATSASQANSRPSYTPVSASASPTDEKRASTPVKAKKAGAELDTQSAEVGGVIKNFGMALTQWLQMPAGVPQPVPQYPHVEADVSRPLPPTDGALFCEALIFYPDL